MENPKKKFKVGDKVKMLITCSGSVQGQIYTLKMIKGAANCLATYNPITKKAGCACKANWQLVTALGSNPAIEDLEWQCSQIQDSINNLQKGVI
jgi:hypothetical protein